MDFFNINTNANTNRLKKEKSKMELVDKIYNWMTKVKDSDPPKKFRAPKKVNRKKMNRFFITIVFDTVLSLIVIVLLRLYPLPRYDNCCQRKGN